MKLWEEILHSAQVKPHEVMPAVKAHIAGSKYFPAPSEIIEMVIESRMANAGKKSPCEDTRQALPAREIDPAEKERRMNDFRNEMRKERLQRAASKPEIYNPDGSFRGPLLKRMPKAGADAK